jgi:membrane-bound lytic murein transglycosylase MltF
MGHRRIGGWIAAAIVIAAGAVPARAQTAGAEPPSAMVGAVIKPWTGDLDGMIKRRVIRILTPYSRTHYFVDKGQPRGLVADAARKLEEEINRRLGTTPQTRVHVAVQPTSRDQLYTALVEGRGDIVAAGITVTPEREKLVDFAIPGFSGVKEVIVTGPGAAVVRTVDDLSGLYICVREKSIHFDSLKALNQTLAARGRKPIAIRTVPGALEDEDILEMVSAGLIKAAVVDDYMADFWSQILPSLTVRHDLVVRESGDIAWAVRKNSPKLLGELNAFAKTHRQGTLFGNVLLQKYLKSTKVVKSSTSPAELSKFRALQEIFKKYAGSYDLDYVLMMAQGYQESGLDQTVRSHVGAIGVMQVMPATGRDMKVGDVHQIDANVHAGVKYIRFMIDQFFANEPIDRLNKALFAFAAYNCGPGRLRQLRAEAKRRGLNPNVWFNNVEHIAGERVGRETVQYVGNIYKYYIAYQLALQDLEHRKALKARTAAGN